METNIFFIAIGYFLAIFCGLLAMTLAWGLAVSLNGLGNLAVMTLYGAAFALIPFSFARFLKFELTRARSGRERKLGIGFEILAGALTCCGAWLVALLPTGQVDYLPNWVDTSKVVTALLSGCVAGSVYWLVACRGACTIWTRVKA